jgi:hypothetical protein
VRRKSIPKAAKRPQKPKTAPATEMRPLIQSSLPTEGSSHVFLVTTENSYELPVDILGGLSTYWDYVSRHRSRWLDSPAAQDDLGNRAVDKLGSLGVIQEALDEISRLGIVEVRVPFTEEVSGWAARTLPWELLLRLATGKRDLVVIRHLDVTQTPLSRGELRPNKLLFVESAPGTLSGIYNFEIERWLVEGSLGLENSWLETPSVGELEDRVCSYKPDVVHLTGIDLHEGDFVQKYKGPDREWDGYYLKGATIRDRRVNAYHLGAILNAYGLSGSFVGCNFFYSAARVASLAVACGAFASIGFQDQVSNALAERFFASFYQRWRGCGWNLLDAFREAWWSVARNRGAGLVLWSRASLIRQQAKSRTKSVSPKPKEITGDTSEVFKIEVQPNPEINYSRLHNGEGLFRKFRVYKSEPRYARGIEVRVALNMGSESFPYEAAFDFKADDSVLDLAKNVNLPLTSALARSLRERVQTSLRVRVRYAGQELYNHTHRVTLLPVNEWRFDQAQGARWLGSFVLPGDPAVRNVVDAAQKYLMALADDNATGFDGYQSTNPEEDCEDPHEGLDMQVRALWCALSFEYSLSYINPPPVFTAGSQRLRTPSDVIDGHRGTCVDLALLFAACLEYVDIYPVIFVLTDHAFPGYWRSQNAYDEFIKMSKAPDKAGSNVGVSMDFDSQLVLAYEEMRQCVRDGFLVPLETVFLTQHRGFSDAVQGGIENLRSSSNFEALLNLRKLREENVTPLPICGEMP